jgi:predicted nucleic acid-binding protein
VSVPFVDTDVVIGLLAGDDLDKQRRARALFERVERGELVVAAPDTVIADAVYVLASRRLYNLPRAEVAALLVPLASLPGFRVQHRRAVLAALRLYGAHAGLDFSDALIVALARAGTSGAVFSYDTDYDAFPGIRRLTP